MTKSSALDKLLATLNVESEPEVFDVEKNDMIRYALATGQTMPWYLNEAAARHVRFGGLIATPTYTSALRFFESPSAQAIYLKVTKHSLDVGMEFFFHEPIRPGDRLTVIGTVIEISEKTGRTGQRIVRTIELRFTNQFGQLVLRQTLTGLLYD